MAKCSVANISIAKKQTERLLVEAKKLAKNHAQCTIRLQSAQNAFDDAGKVSKGLEQRNAYIRASFQAGQARTCGIVAGLIEAPGVRAKPKLKRVFSDPNRVKAPKKPRVKKPKVVTPNV